MKTPFTLALTTMAVLAGSIHIAPAGNTTSDTSKEFTRGPCRDIILLFARGTTETGNMGGTVGPALSKQLKAHYGETRVAVEGVDYAAVIATNFNAGGADFDGISELERLLYLASTKCPESAVVVSGYSQGAALTHRAVEKVPYYIMHQIAAAVTFGDTQNSQDGERIHNFPRFKTLIVCNPGDDVCHGNLNIRPAHLDYVRRVPEAVEFIADMAK